MWCWDRELEGIQNIQMIEWVLHADYAMYSNLTTFPGKQNLVLRYQRDVLASWQSAELCQ